ncbi:MAG: Fibronectin type 3 domain protein [Candidatus Ozemobacter sibiricus]|jgi:hypothetical protein|uniref:Fibronectin type 3 domain protein n=1 Tax=Candidatus Ozemobacter sibiricus TaxID=2268124 RepID=A0A367ZTS2_9BACT|nr:MAG: Fibronectin type 3 domain protein [Candidatus Ozemobacter sibiricus]
MTTFRRIGWPLWGPTLLFLAGLLLLGCDANNNVTPREGALEGKVFDVSGKPLQYVLVSWTLDRTRWGLSDASGKFFVEGVGFGEQTFIAEKTGFRPTTFRAAIYSGGISVLPKVVLETASFDFKEVKVEKVSATTALVTWKTTDYTNGIIEYGETEAYGRTVREPDLQYATVHSLEITDLKPNTKYFFRIVAARQNRPAETSTGHSFVTLATYDDREVPSTPRGVTAALTEQPNTVTIFWSPNSERDLRGYRVYRSESPIGRFSAIEGMLIAKGQERFLDAGVTTGKKYYYRVSAVDLAGNESGPSEAVSVVIPGLLTQEVTWVRANSPYLLSGDLTIDRTGILRIDPGVEVLIADTDALRVGNPAKVEVTVRGTLVASAGQDFPIIISSARSTPAAGDWSGITFLSNPSPESALVNVTLAYAETGLTLTEATGTFADTRIHHCQTGIAASRNQGLRLASLTLEICQKGLMISGNTSPMVTGCTLFHCLSGVTSSNNDGLTFEGNNLLEFTDFGLMTNEAGGTLLVRNNLFVSAVGVGLHVLSKSPSIEYNTFDAPYGIRIDQGNMPIRKNILVADRSPGGMGLKGIEHLGGAASLPVVGPNAVAGFPAGKDYVGCASAPGSLASRPVFMKDEAGGGYDYRLSVPFPDGLDPWGIKRETPPR